MENSLTFQDARALFSNDDTREERHRCGRNTALWCIMAALILIAILWFCYRVSNDKAELAAGIQNIAGHVNCIAPQVQTNESRLFETIGAVNRNSAAAETYAHGVNRDLAALNNRVFYEQQCGSRNSNGCQRSGFIKTDNYTFSDSNLQNIQTCGNV